MPAKKSSIHTTPKTITVAPGTKLLTTEEAAEMIGRPPATLVYWRYQGIHLPFLKAGKTKCARVFYRQSDVEEYLRRSNELVEHQVEGKEGDNDGIK